MSYQSLFRSLAAVAALCTTMAAAPAQAATFTIKDCDNPDVTSAQVTGAGTTAILITCSSGTTTPPDPLAPSGCTIGVTGSPVPNTGGSATVALNNGSCNNTDASTTWQWFRNSNSQGAASTTYGDMTDTFNANGGAQITHTFALKVCNGSACMTTPSKNVTQTASSTGGGGGDFCGSASLYEVDLSPNGQFATAGGGNLGGFFGDQIFVGRWTLPSYTGTDSHHQGQGQRVRVWRTRGAPRDHNLEVQV